MGWFVRSAFLKGDASGGDAMDLPDPPVCNLHVAVAWVAAAPGLGEVLMDVAIMRMT